MSQPFHPFVKRIGNSIAHKRQQDPAARAAKSAAVKARVEAATPEYKAALQAQREAFLKKSTAK